MFNTLTLNQLTDEQLFKLSQVAPKFVFKYKPNYMAYYHTDWVAKYSPSWLCGHNPRWMVMNKPDWVSFHKPEIMADFDLELLVHKNPSWVVNHIPERIAYEYPELLKEYDGNMYLEHRPEETTDKTKGFFSKLLNRFKNMIQYKPNKDVPVPKEYLSVIKEPAEEKVSVSANAYLQKIMKQVDKKEEEAIASHGHDSDRKIIGIDGF